MSRGRGCPCRRGFGLWFFERVFHQAIEGANAILPPDHLSFFIGAFPVGDPNLIDTQVAACALHGDFRFEAEAVLLNRKRLNYFAPENPLTGFHVRRIDVGEAV